jgi:DNA-binding LacI/PurR family transcriptional regulator
MTETERVRGGGTRRPTLEDVAQLAGVSLMTASRAMNNARYVSEDAHRRVWEASDTLGFVPHHGARSLATNKSGSVALIVPMAENRFFSDPNVAPIISGVNAALSDEGTQLVVLIAGNSAQTKRIGNFVKARHVDGAIVVSPDLIRSTVTELQNARIPIVGSGAIIGVSSFDRVTIDSQSAVFEIVSLLRDAGCVRIGLIAGGRNMDSTKKQLAGYIQAIGPGATPIVEHGDFSQQSGRDATLRLFSENPDLDGLFAANDVMALGALQALGELRKRVPADVRVAGFDDSAAAQAAIPSLTTVAVPFYEIGRKMAKLVLQRIDNPERDLQRLVLPTTIVRRESA